MRLPTGCRFQWGPTTALPGVDKYFRGRLHNPAVGAAAYPPAVEAVAPPAVPLATAVPIHPPRRPAEEPERNGQSGPPLIIS